MNNHFFLKEGGVGINPYVLPLLKYYIFFRVMY